MFLIQKSAKIFSFKMVPKRDKAYLEFQKHTSSTATLKVLFTLHGDNYCSPLQLKTVSVSFTFGEIRAVKCFAACISQTTINGATWPIFHQHILQGNAAHYVHSCSLFSVWYNCWSCLCLLQEECTKINIYVCFLYNFFSMYGAQFTVSISTKHRTHSFARGSHFLI